MILANSNTSSVSVRLKPIPFRAIGSASSCTVFCDLDGPLIDVSERYYKTYRLAIEATQKHYRIQGRAIAVRPLKQPHFWHLKLERIPDSDIAAMTGFVEDQVDFFLETVRQLVNQPDLLQEDRLQPWAVEALEQFAQSGATLSLVTLRSQDQAIHLLKRFGIYHYFSRIQGSTDEFAAYDNYASCKAAMLSTLVDLMNLSSYEGVWMIGDTEADVLSAKALGISSIALSCGMRSLEYLQRLEPTCVLGDLAQAAQYVIKTLKQEDQIQSD